MACDRISVPGIQIGCSGLGLCDERHSARCSPKCSRTIPSANQTEHIRLVENPVKSRFSRNRLHRNRHEKCTREDYESKGRRFEFCRAPIKLYSSNVCRVFLCFQKTGLFIKCSPFVPQRFLNYCFKGIRRFFIRCVMSQTHF